MIETSSSTIHAHPVIPPPPPADAIDQDRLTRGAHSMRTAMNETLEQKSKSLLALLWLLSKQETLIDAMDRAA